MIVFYDCHIIFKTVFPPYMSLGRLLRTVPPDRAGNETSPSMGGVRLYRLGGLLILPKPKRFVTQIVGGGGKNPS